MHQNPFRKEPKFTKAQKKIMKKVIDNLNRETDRQLDIIYHATAIALHRYHGWNAEQLHDLIANVSQEIWNECAGDRDVSMIELCWDYLGIELQCEDKSQRWFEVQYLNSDIVDYSPITVYQYIAMRQNQLKWIAPQITACMLISIYRKEGWKEDAVGRLFVEIEDIKHEFGLDPDRLREACGEETDFFITNDTLPVDRQHAFL